MKRSLVALLFVSALFTPGCGKKKEKPAPQAGTESTAQPEAALVGVDMKNKVVSVGMLNDESGPGAAIGKPFASGKRLLVQRINAGQSGLLPEGWTIKLIEKDHGYNPQQSVQQYNAIKNDVLFIGTSFGTPNTLPLRPSLERDGIVAFPASLSSQMAENEHTPPTAPSYAIEAMRAMDWVVEQAGDAARVKAAIVYQEDDYGKDGLEGWKKAAAHHGVSIVAETAVAPGQKDVTAVISTLKNAGATHVLLTVLPSSTGPILGTARQLTYAPVWIGNTPAWLDRFFSRDVIPPDVFGSFYWVTGLPYWGEDLPGMDGFMAAWNQHGKDMGEPDSYILMSYLAGLIQTEALRRAIESGDLSRAGYKRALRSIKDWNAGGLLQPLDLSAVPYMVGTRTRVLQPVMDQRQWKTVAEYAEPTALQAGE
jgi:ABC-type branched-subunit amino acid transport system substrate-binding protein